MKEKPKEHYTRRGDITDEQRKVVEFLRRNYPNVEPCAKCKYWRKLTSGKLFNATETRSDNFYNKRRLILEGVWDEPACYFLFDTGELRGEYTCHRGYCDHFQPRVKLQKGRPKKNEL